MVLVFRLLGPTETAVLREIPLFNSQVWGSLTPAQITCPATRQGATKQGEPKYYTCSYTCRPSVKAGLPKFACFA